MGAKFLLVCGLWLACSGLASADEFGEFLKPLFADNCVKCHGGEKVKGKINLKEIASGEQLLAKPKLLEKVLGAIDANDMPPEDADNQPSDEERQMFVDWIAGFSECGLEIDARLRRSPIPVASHAILRDKGRNPIAKGLFSFGLKRRKIPVDRRLRLAGPDEKQGNARKNRGHHATAKSSGHGHPVLGFICAHSREPSALTQYESPRVARTGFARGLADPPSSFDCTIKPVTAPYRWIATTLKTGHPAAVRGYLSPRTLQPADCPLLWAWLGADCA